MIARVCHSYYSVITWPSSAISTLMLSSILAFTCEQIKTIIERRQVCLRGPDADKVRKKNGTRVRTKKNNYLLFFGWIQKASFRQRENGQQWSTVRYHGKVLIIVVLLFEGPWTNRGRVTVSGFRDWPVTRQWPGDRQNTTFFIPGITTDYIWYCKYIYICSVVSRAADSSRAPLSHTSPWRRRTDFLFHFFFIVFFVCILLCVRVRVRATLRRRAASGRERKRRNAR